MAPPGTRNAVSSDSDAPYVAPARATDRIVRRRGGTGWKWKIDSCHVRPAAVDARVSRHLAFPLAPGSAAPAQSQQVASGNDRSSRDFEVPWRRLSPALRLLLARLRTGILARRLLPQGADHARARRALLSRRAGPSRALRFCRAEVDDAARRALRPVPRSSDCARRRSRGDLRAQGRI